MDGGDALPDRAQAKAAHLDRLVGDLFAFTRREYALDPITSIRSTSRDGTPRGQDASRGAPRAGRL